MKLLLAILGPTASGKTVFAIDIAEKLDGEIICLDSSTIYRGLDIGTSKPTAEERKRIPHHLVDIQNPDEPFSAYHFVEKASQIIDDIWGRNRLPIVVGGTYFYLRALQHGMYPDTFVSPQILEEIEKSYFEDEQFNQQRMHDDLKKLDPASAEKIHPNDRYRLVRALAIIQMASKQTVGKLPSELKPEKVSSTAGHWLKYAMVISRRELGNNIVRRTESMLAGGLVAEVKGLLERYPKARSLGCIGYTETARFLSQEITDKQLRNEIIEKTRQLAKRQITWIRSDPEIRFIDRRDGDRIALEVANLRYAMETPP